jgi:colanic acid biosynthesis glycosyl transferase WcaI
MKYHFLLLNRFFGDDLVPTGRMLLDVAECLVQQGHRVDVVTSRQKYTGHSRSAQSYGRLSVSNTFTGFGSALLVQWPLFWVQAMFRLAFGRWTRCLILTDPPFMILGTLVAKRRRGSAKKCFWWTMDLYPEAMIAKGMIAAAGPTGRFLRWLNTVGLRRTDGVIALGGAQRDILRRYRTFSESELIVAPPWDKRSLLDIPMGQNEFLRKYGLHGKRVALYAGNLGEAHSFEEILAAAALASEGNDRSWVFVFVVRGVRVAELTKASEGLENVAVLEYQPREMLSDLLSAATVHLVTMQSGWAGIVVPSKLYGIACSRRPVLFIGPEAADTASEIERWDLGDSVPAGAAPSEILGRLKVLAEAEPRPAVSPNLQQPERIAAFLTDQIAQG